MIKYIYKFFKSDEKEEKSKEEIEETEFLDASMLQEIGDLIDRLKKFISNLQKDYEEAKKNDYLPIETLSKGLEILQHTINQQITTLEKMRKGEEITEEALKALSMYNLALSYNALTNKYESSVLYKEILNYPHIEMNKKIGFSKSN